MAVGYVGVPFEMLCRLVTGMLCKGTQVDVLNQSPGTVCSRNRNQHEPEES